MGFSVSFFAALRSSIVFSRAAIRVNAISAKMNAVEHDVDIPDGFFELKNQDNTDEDDAS